MWAAWRKKCGKVERVVGVSVYVYGTVPFHEGAESESEEGDVGTFASFINV